MKRTRFANRIAMPAIAGSLFIAACGSNPDSASVDVAVQGEKLESLDIANDKISGVFAKADQRLAFEISRHDGVVELSLRTQAGEPLYFTRTGPDGSTLQLGTGFQSFLPAGSMMEADGQPSGTPAGFQSNGDMTKAIDGLKNTPFVLLPNLAAALGRAGLNGRSSSLASVIQLTALRFATDLGFKLDDAVLQQTNRVVTGSGASDENTEVASTSEALSADWSKTTHCQSGVGREFFGNGLRDNPCRDTCFGMCGPDCTPWTFVCGDTAVHPLCWQHDSAYCPVIIHDPIFGLPIPNPTYPLCLTVYSVYSAAVAVASQASACGDNAPVPYPMYTHRPGYYTVYGKATQSDPVDCGDHSCNGSESCSSCGVDCGGCPTSTPWNCWAPQALPTNVRFCARDTGKACLVMQSDGNLVDYDEAGRPRWASNTAGNPGAAAYFQGDGNLVIYRADGVVLWASNTFSGDPVGVNYLCTQGDGNVVIYKWPRAAWATNTVH